MKLGYPIFCLLFLYLLHCCQCKRSYKPVSQDDAKKYLSTFGYVGTSNMLNAMPVGKLEHEIEETFSSLQSAIRKFQEFAGLRVTGELDEPTREKMAQPRCGVTDVLAITKGGASSFKWNKNDLTYSLESYSPDLPRDDIKRAMAQAFNAWSEVTPLNFKEVSSGADIKIKFASKNHNDPWPFDGKGGVLAHATMPTSGMLHFDDDENWVYMNTEKLAKYDYTDLLAVAIHESGHTLGLDHSRDETAIMAPFYQETVDRNGNYIKPILKRDDINKIQEIYGPRKGAAPKNPSFGDNGGGIIQLKPATGGSEEEDTGFFGRGGNRNGGSGRRPAYTTRRPSINDHPDDSGDDSESGSLDCPFEIDSAVSVRGSTYLFSSSRIYEVKNQRIVKVHSMTSLFPNGPIVTTGAFTNPDEGITYLIHDNQLYGYTFDNSRRKFSLKRGYPKRFPASMKFGPLGAFRWTDGRNYLFNANDFVVYDDNFNEVTMEGRKFDYFKNFPRVDAIRGAVEDGDNMLIFTTSNVYSYNVDRSEMNGVEMPLRRYLKC